VVATVAGAAGAAPRQGALRNRRRSQHRAYACRPFVPVKQVIWVSVLFLFFFAGAASAVPRESTLWHRRRAQHRALRVGAYARAQVLDLLALLVQQHKC
jgi:hypothetical protein